jgi:hypothetical protein
MICKARRSGFLFLVCISMTVGSCVEPIVPVLNEKDSESVLVVDGKVTDEAGPFRVRLTRSVKVNVLYYLDPVLDADVRIYDDKGNFFQLYSVNYGWYESEDKNLKGVPGNAYTLSVTTADGMQYESSSVLMSEAPDIDSLYFQEITRTRLEGNQGIEETWMNILLDTHDPESKIKYWYYEFSETWEVKMITDVLVEHSPPGTPSNKTTETVIISDDKSVCWVTKPSSTILLANTVSSPVDEIKGFTIQSLEPSEDKLHIRYSILVKQAAISRELYDFWKQLKDVNEDAGGLYEKLPSQVFGNISCCGGTARALGYFSALSVKAKRLFIERTEHHMKTKSAYDGCSYYDYVPMPYVPKSFFGVIKDSGTEVYCSSDYCADCRAYGTNVKPDFW